eukprot:scpid77270/ scgid32349/ 
MATANSGSLPGSPFDDPRFDSSILKWIRLLHASTLRNCAQREGLLTLEQLSDLRRRERNDGTAEHNTALIRIISRKGRSGYIALCRAIKGLRLYATRLTEMQELLAPSERV